MPLIIGGLLFPNIKNAGNLDAKKIKHYIGTKKLFLFFQLLDWIENSHIVESWYKAFNW